jgi:2-keto-3-deoxy-L-rhamnonate aldolase RhmA
MKEVAEHLNRQQVVGVLIEDGAAVDDIDQIIRTPGLDFVFIGPEDLAASMGLIGTRGHPQVTEAINRVIEACGRATFPFSTFAGHPSVSGTTAELAQRNGTLLLVGVDSSLLLAGLKGLLTRIQTGQL